MKKGHIKIILLAIFIFSLISIIIKVMLNGNKIDFKTNNLIGKWTTDGVTVYEFEENGKGVLKLPLSKYRYSYIIDSNKLHINFENKEATDSDYEYYFDNNKLVLKGINRTSGTYVFLKQ